GIVTAATMLALLFSAGVATAAHLGGSIDCTSSSLTDLNAAIQANWHSNFLGGFRQDSVFSDTPGSLADFCSKMQTRSNRIGNPGDVDFCYYPNAYDMVHAYLLYDPYDNAGNSVYSGHTNIYAGW